MRRALSLAATLFFACTNSSGGEAGGIGTYQSCATDSDCPQGQGCDTEGGQSTDGYCTPLCAADTDCPTGFDCPSEAKNQPGECDELGDHRDAKGVCDQFDGVSGPNTCGQ